MEKIDLNEFNVFTHDDLLEIMNNTKIDENTIKLVAFEICDLINNKIANKPPIENVIVFDEQDETDIEKKLYAENAIIKQTTKTVINNVIYKIVRKFNVYLNEENVILILKRDVLNDQLISNLFTNEPIISEIEEEVNINQVEIEVIKEEVEPVVEIEKNDIKENQELIIEKTNDNTLKSAVEELENTFNDYLNSFNYSDNKDEVEVEVPKKEVIVETPKDDEQNSKDADLINSRLEESLSFFDELEDSLNGNDLVIKQSEAEKKAEAIKDLNFAIANSRINEAANRVVFDATEEINLKEILHDKDVKAEIIEKIEEKDPIEVQDEVLINDDEEIEDREIIQESIDVVEKEDEEIEDIKEENVITSTLYEDYEEKDDSIILRILILVVILGLIGFIFFGVIKLKNKGLLSLLPANKTMINMFLNIS